jgi:RHH-type rel operon transcriptional repressor/antitoxin RelB
MSKKLSARVADELYLKLSEIAKETGRFKSFNVQKALEVYLSDINDLQLAYDRLHNKTDPVISIDALRKDLQ